METRANYAIIGLFTIAVIGAAFGFVFWFAGTESGTDRPSFRIVFSGSVAGLSKGSPVLFNGIRVGDVNTVDLSDQAPDQAFATIQVAKTTPIRADTKASLEVNLLSGVAQVGLTGGARDAPPLQKRDPSDPFPTIMAEQGGLGSIINTVRGTAEKANVLLDALNGVVSENRGTIAATFKNAQAFSDALAKNAPALDNLLASIADAAKHVGPLATKLEVLADDTSSLVRSVETDRVKNIVRNFESFTQTVDENRTAVASILRDGAGLIGRLNEAAPKLDQALTDAGRILATVDPVKLNQVVDNAQRFMGGLAASTPDLQGALRNANSLTAKLNSSADRVDELLQAGQRFLGSATGKAGEGAFESVRLAADAFRKASENLDRRATEIAQGVTRFSGVGSRQIEALSTDARRTVNTVGRAAGVLEKNPSSVIFGTGRASIPEYSGR